MSNYLVKVKHIGPMFAYVCWVTTLLLVMLRWVFAIHFKIFDFSDKFWEIWMPFLAPVPGVLLVLPIKTKAIVYRNKKYKRGLPMISYMVIVAMLVISQKFTTAYFGELRQVKTVNEIDRHPLVKYYKIEYYVLPQRWMGRFVKVSTSGRGRMRLNFDGYAIFPMLSDTSIVDLQKPAKYWYGFHINQRYSNTISEAHKKEYYTHFVQYFLTQAHASAYQKPDHFENLNAGDHQSFYLKSVSDKFYTIPEDAVVLSPVYETYDERTGNLLLWVFGAFGIGTILLAIQLTEGEFYTKELLKS